MDAALVDWNQSVTLPAKYVFRAVRITSGKELRRYR